MKKLVEFVIGFCCFVVVVVAIAYISGVIGHQSIPGGEADERQKLLSQKPRRPGPGFLDGLLHPAERALSAKSPFKSINIHYPRRTTPVWSWNVPWWLTSMLVYLLTAMFAGWRFGVEF